MGNPGEGSPSVEYSPGQAPSTLECDYRHLKLHLTLHCKGLSVSDSVGLEFPFLPQVRFRLLVKDHGPDAETVEFILTPQTPELLL